MPQDPSSSAPCTQCGQARVLKFKEFQFYWMDGAEIDLQFAENAVLEIHPTYIVIDGINDRKLVIPMDRLKVIDAGSPV